MHPRQEFDELVECSEVRATGERSKARGWLKGRFMEGIDIQAIVKQAVQEFVSSEQQRSEPAYKAELAEERKRRESLEKKFSELVEENNRSKKAADEAERQSAIRAELQRLGVAKIDLAYRAVQDGVARGADGRFVARGDRGDTGLKEYLSDFVNENPEFLPARIPGGSGMTATQKAAAGGSDTITLDRIRPGMSAEEMQRVREEIVRVASQTLRGL